MLLSILNVAIAAVVVVVVALALVVAVINPPFSRNQRINHINRPPPPAPLTKTHENRMNRSIKPPTPPNKRLVSDLGLPPC